MGAFEPIADVAIDPATARVFEHGWQSWSPTATWSVTDPRRARLPPPIGSSAIGRARPYRTARSRARACWPSALDGADVHVFGVDRADRAVASIRASRDGDLLRVTADGPVGHVVDEGPGGIDGALARWADGFAARAGLSAIRRAPTIWCSWYQYFTEVSEADIDENLAAMARLDLPIDIVQVDDGYQAEIGDWLALSGRFASLDGLIGRIRGAGRRAGIWVAPFLVGARSETARLHPDWLVRDRGDAASRWMPGSTGISGCSPSTRPIPAARAYLADVFAGFRALGIDFFKIDFVYAGAIPGRRHDGSITEIEAYRRGMELIRDAIGDAYLLGCGAPILPSVGLVDAMRIGPDTGAEWEPEDGDLSKPAGRSSVVTGTGRAFQHGRFWVNDPDCIIARPGSSGARSSPTHIARFGGLRGSSDRLAELDDWGLATTRALLASSPAEPFIASGVAPGGSPSGSGRARPLRPAGTRGAAPTRPAPPVRCGEERPRPVARIDEGDAADDRERSRSAS